MVQNLDTPQVSLAERVKSRQIKRLVGIVNDTLVAPHLKMDIVLVEQGFSNTYWDKSVYAGVATLENNDSSNNCDLI